MQGGVLGVGLLAVSVFLFHVTAHVSYHGPVAALLAVNALIARFTDGTIIYVVPTPSKPKDKGGLKSSSSDTAAQSKLKGKGAVQSGSTDTTKED